MRFRLRNLTLTVTAACALAFGAGCGATVGIDHSSPDNLLKSTMAAMEKDDLAAVLRAMHPQQLQTMKDGWAKFAADTVSDVDNAQFSAVITQLTSPGGVDTVYAMIKPQLEEIQAQKKQMGGILVAMLASQAVDQNNPKARDVAKAMGEWLINVDLTNEGKVKASLTTAAETLTKLGIKDLKSLKALTWDAMIDKSSVLYAGIATILAGHGFDLRQLVKGCQVGKASISGTSAKIPVTMNLFGVTMTNDADCELVNGKWYGADKKGLEK